MPIDPVEFGRTIAAMQNLNDRLVAMDSRLAKTDESMDKLSSRMGEMEEKYRMGKFGLSAVMLVIAFALFGVKETISEIWSIVAR